MGFFNDVKEKFNKATGLGENNDLFNVGATLLTGGGTALIDQSEKGKLKDLFLGKKAKDKNPDDIANEIRATQSKGIRELNSALDKPSSDIVRQQVETQKRGVLTAAQDARRNAQRLMAQRGLKGTSLGLASNRSIDQSQGSQLAQINSAIPGLIRNQAIQDAGSRIGVGGLGTSQGIRFQKEEGQRSGGILGIASSLAPTIGTVAGAYMGGPQGAAMGGQMGGGIGQALGQPQQPTNPYNPNNYSMGSYNF